MRAASSRRSPLFSVVVLVGVLPAAAPAAPLDEQSWHYEAHLITVGAGSSAVERLGRSLLTVGRVRPGRIEDVVYDLGRPESEISWLDYLTGRATVKVLRVGTVTRALRAFVAEGRRVDVQKLQLQAGELERLRAALVAELQPRRQAYPIHPLGETSATRARDLIDSVMGQALRKALSGGGNQTGSARELLRLELAGRPDAELLLDLFGGRALDRLLDPHQALFLPRRLRQAVSETSRGGTAIAERPTPIHRGQPLSREVIHPAAKLAWIWAVALAVVGLLALWRAPQTRLAGIWLLMGPITVGILGFSLLWVVLLGRTVEARSNELLLSFLSTDLLLLPIALRWLLARSAAGRLLLGYAAARAGLMLVVLVAHAAGVLYQQPRALLAPPLVAAMLLLAIVLRMRAATGAPRARRIPA